MWLWTQYDLGAHREGAVGCVLDPRVDLDGWVWWFQDDSFVQGMQT